MKFPSLNNKYALMRAYKYTTLEEGDGDAWVERDEFPSLLKNLFFFNKVGACVHAHHQRDVASSLCFRCATALERIFTH